MKNNNPSKEELYSKRPFGKPDDLCAFCDEKVNNGNYTLCNDHTDALREARRADDRHRLESRVRACDHCGALETPDNIMVDEPTDGMACWVCHESCDHDLDHHDTCMNCGEEIA